MLLEKVRRCAGTQMTSPKNAHKIDNGLGQKIPVWFGKELSKWAEQFDIVDASGKPLSFTTKELLQQNPDFENTSVAALLDKKSCRQVTSQVALLSRLRSIFMTKKEDEVRENVVQSVKQSRKLEDVWDKRPSWWEDTVDVIEDAYDHNYLLLERLADHGFLNVLSEDAKGFGPTIEEVRIHADLVYFVQLPIVAMRY
jgi:hypothetical protein